jgi:hypothetical protein
MVSPRATKDLVHKSVLMIARKMESEAPLNRISNSSTLKT